ncbi:MAG: HAD family phosphatase [Clostridia bacterium]|nr:HAD family phosphatase [Clostridia bacterium]
MRKINYPLIISDFDGTLLRTDETVSIETKRAIENYIEAGGCFAISTGRTLASILPLARSLGLKGLVSSFQGSVIADIESGKLVVDGAMEQSGAAAICREMESLGLHIHVYTLENFYSNMQDKMLEDYEQTVGVKGKVIDSQPLSSFIMSQNLKVRKVLTILDPARKMEVFQKIDQKFGKDFNVTYSAAYLVEATNPDYSKATAAEAIAQFYGVPLERTVGVGDSLNDLPMIERVGLGIAVKNADEKLKEKAYKLEYTNDENAIGRIIERFGYEGNE